MVSRTLLFLSLLFGAGIAHSPGRAIKFLRRSNCGTDTAWEATPSAYVAAKTDSNLAGWWKNTSSRPHGSFPNELAKQFGSHINGFECGIGDDSTCYMTGCSDFEANGDPPWTYLALQAVVGLNVIFNRMYDGINLGQADYQALIGNLTEDFFPWRDAQYQPKSSYTWAGWAVSSFVGGVVGSAVGGAIQSSAPQVEQSWTRGQGEAQFGVYVSQLGQTLRTWMQNWANATFQGVPDSANNTILDYIRGGRPLGLTMPSPVKIEEFYKQALVSKTVNSQWASQKTFLFSTLTTNPNDTSGPINATYYSDGRVYYLYSYITTGRLGGRLDAPANLDKLAAPPYSISPSDITMSSARAWITAGFNYTDDISRNQTVEAFSSNNTLAPFVEGAGLEGIWTLPVCDIGHNIGWNVQYGHDPRKHYGTLPCCCGPNCTDTKTFVNLAGFQGLQTLLVGCKEQLAGSNSSIPYSQIDYGFREHLNFRQKWDSWTIGQRAGVGIGMTLAVLVAQIGLLACCAAAADH